MTAVHVTGVTASYGGPPVLDGLDLQVQAGELLALLGASGSGKTTLLRVLAGFIRPTAGQVDLGGRTVVGPGTWVPPERRRIGIVPQEGALFPHLDVAANVAFGLPRGSGPRVAEMLELIGMAGMGSRRPHELSGGQQQRVALARALAPMPDVVCLDEPFAALDASLRERLREEVREILHASGTTAILVTHDQQEALSIADRVAIVRDGLIAQVDEPRRIYRRPADLDIARFISEVVELRGVVRDRALRDPKLRDPNLRDPHLVETAVGAIEIEGEIEGELAPGASGVVVLRPEQFTLSRPRSDEHSAARVLKSTFYGRISLVRARLQDGQVITIQVPGCTDIQPGDPVVIRVNGPACLFVPSSTTPGPSPAGDRVRR